MTLFLFALMGCKDEAIEPSEPIDEVFSGCDPLDPANCLYPFPSSYHLAQDPSTVTGRRVDYGPTALPRYDGGLQLSPTFWNEKDGYSLNSTLLFYFEGGSEQGLVDSVSLAQHDAPDAKTVLVDLTTGARIPHWVELDATADSDFERAYLLHPAIPLEHDREYAVGVRGLTTSSGEPVTPSEAFVALRDGDATRDWDIEYRRQRFDAVVFPALAAHGFARGELQLAWDFHTISQESSIGRMVWMKDDALERVGPDGPDYTVVEVVDEDCADAGRSIGRTLEIDVTAPMYTEIDGPSTLLTRDEQGQPFYNGDLTFGVTVRIPCSVLTDPQPSRVIQYGHGLLGDRGEARTGWLGRFADEAGYIVVATDWVGMSEEDVIPLVTMSGTDISQFAIVPERSMQGVLQQLLVMPLMHGPLKDDAAFTVDGVSLIDPTRSGYYGISQGGIMGGTILSLSSTLQRGVLGVSGVNYGLLLTRSHDFDFYYVVIRQNFQDDRDVALLVQGLVQQLWDTSEGGGYLHTVTRDPLPGIAANQVLIHNAIGDNQVSTLAGHIQARAYGASLIGPATRPIFGIDETTADHTGSGIVEWHYSDVPPEPIGNLPPDGPDPHECPRREAQGRAQIMAFFEDGVIRPACDGVCSSSVAETCPD